MKMLPLDDPRWKDLDHRNWSHGKRSDWAPDAPYIPDELAKLVRNPADLQRFRDLWPWLCSEGTTWAAAYAAVPYMVALAKRLPPEQRLEYLCVVGLVVTDSCPEEGESFAIKAYLVEGYRQALADTLPLLTETLMHQFNLVDTRYLLAALAALQGHRKLARVLQQVDCICGECPGCGEWVYPPELQEVVQ
jgi:hypothetical protein